MIIKDLSKFIYLDEIRSQANPLEVYFLSHLLDLEMLNIPDNWPGRIYTSEFIFDILSRQNPEVYPKYFQVLQPNVPIKLKSKEKTIMVTMFETEEITNTVMYFFDDGISTHLYTGVFTEIVGIYRNELFMSIVQKGIDYVYVDSTRCNGTSYIFTDETVEEIKQIAKSHPNSQLAVIIPTYGYEKLLVYLAKEFPQDVFPNKHQRRVLTKLGYKDLLAKTSNARIFILKPGITLEAIESTDIVTIYIIQGKIPTDTIVCGMYLRQWSPLPSVMDLQALLDIIRPKNIIPIRKVPHEEITALPGLLKWFISKKQTGGDEVRSNADPNESHESETDNDSICSIGSSCTTTSRDRETIDLGASLASTRVFLHPASRSKDAYPHSSKDNDKITEIVVEQTTKQDPITAPETEPVAKKSTRISCEISQKRRRIVRQRSVLEFVDSDDDDDDDDDDDE